jgi:hypothetical protein
MGRLSNFFDQEAPRENIEVSGSRFTSASYADNVVRWAADNSADTVAQMIKLGAGHVGRDNIFSRIAAQPKTAQIQAAALHSAVYLVGAALLPGIPKAVAKEIYARISESLVGTNLGPAIGNGLKMGFDVYGQSLFAEMAGSPEDVGFNADGGPTAKVMFDVLRESYASTAFRSSPPLGIPTLDGTRLKVLIHTAIVGQLKAFIELKLRYVQ